MNTQAQAAYVEVEQTTVMTVFITIFFTLFMAIGFGFGLYLFSAIVSDMKESIGYDYFQVGVITALAQVMFLLGSLCSGYLLRLIGGGYLIIAAASTASVCILLLSVVTNVWQMGALLSLLGSTAAVIWVPMVMIVGRFIPYKHRARALGMISSGTGYGQFINGLVVPYGIINHDWTAVWLIIGVLSIVISVCGFITLHALGVLKEKAGPTQARVISEKPTKSRINKTNVAIWLMLFCNGLSFPPFQNYLSPFLRDEAYYSVQTVSGLWSIIGILGMGSGFAIGLLSDKIGIRKSLVLTYILFGMSSVLIYFHTSQFVLILAAILFGLSFFAVYGLVPAYISKTVSPAEAAVIFSIANVALGVGSMIGNFLGGAGQSYFNSLAWIYIATSIIAMFCIYLTWLFPNENKVSVGHE